MSPSEIYGSGEQRPEEEQAGRLEREARMAERLEAAYAEMAEPAEPSKQEKVHILFGEAGEQPESSQPEVDPVEQYEQIIKGEPGSFDGAIYEQNKGERITVSFDTGRLGPPPIEVRKGEAGELVFEEVRDYLKYDLPDFGVGPDRQQGKPTSLIVIGDRGIERRIESGVDERTGKVEGVLAELGFRSSRENIGTHAEAKLLVDMAEEKLPPHVTAAINHIVCGPSRKPWVVSCDALLERGSQYLRDHIGDSSIRLYNNDLTGYFYKDGRRHDSPPR